MKHIFFGMCLLGALICSLSVSAADMKLLADEIEPQVMELRNLPFLTAVEKTFQTPAELREVLQEELDRTYPGEKLHTIEKRLLKFGFVVRPIDLRAQITQLLSQQIGGYYDPIKKKMVLIEGLGAVGGQGTPLPLQIISNMMIHQWGLSIDKILLAHELTHAIQDQHFDLMSLPIEELEQEDLALAARALIEGDATLVMMDYILQHRYHGVDVTMVPEISENMRFWTSSPLIRSFNLFQTIPRYLMDNLLFSYIDGFDFVLQLKEQGGWEAINQAYEDLPASTEQILHPEKYFIERDNPVVIQLPPLADLLEGWHALEHNTLGEFNIRLLLDSYLPIRQVRPASEGWDGDRFVLYEQSGTDQLLLIWYTSWDSEDDAREFFQIYGNVLNIRYGNFHETGAATEDELHLEGRSQYEWSTEDSNIFIKIRGNDVLILDGIPTHLQREVIEELWQNTQISS